MKDDKTYLGHILEAIEKIGRYIEDVGFDEFAENDMMVDAVVRELEIVGEAARNLSETFCQSHPDISLRDAVDMRNFLVHEYFGVNRRIVWDTCHNDLPVFRELIGLALNDG